MSYLGAVAFRNSFYGSGSGPLVLDSVICQGSEMSLMSCSSHPNPTLCSNENEAGVKCQGQFYIT